MIITLVMDKYIGDDGKITNGTTMTTYRFAKKLEEMGNEVRIVTCTKNSASNIYVVPEYNLLYFNKIIHSQGMALGRPVKKTLVEAFEGSDIVHFLMPFNLSRKGKKLCDKMGIASTCAFHVQPENITYTLGIEKSPKINDFIYGCLRGYYNKFNHIHCPSKMIADELKRNRYKAQTHIISNGVDEVFCKKPTVKPDIYKDKIIVMMIGRFSREKRQDLIINAISNSKYKDKIKLILCGVGPEKDNYQKLADKKGVDVEFKFLSQEDLVAVCNYADVYIHSSDVEIEAIACIEAFSCGLVPIISDSKLSATNQFALSEHNLFKNGNYLDLLEKLEFLIEHEDIKNELSSRYIEYSKQFSLTESVNQLLQVFNTAIEENKQKLIARNKA